MKTRRYALALSALALAAASFAANAAIVFQNLGTNAPPATIGGHTLTPFDLTPQIAIPNYTNGISIIPRQSGPRQPRNQPQCLPAGSGQRLVG